jgi:hypothetical protein
MVVPYAAVGAQWWDAHFLSMDYGFGKSSASAHLHVRTHALHIGGKLLEGKRRVSWCTHPRELILDDTFQPLPNVSSVANLVYVIAQGSRKDFRFPRR